MSDDDFEWSEFQMKRNHARRAPTPPNEDELVKALEKWRDWLDSKVDMVQIRFDCPPEPGTQFDYELSLLVSEMTQALAAYRARKGEQ
jgi:hypothetical protein